MPKALRIGNVRLRSRLLLAPMVDVSDLPYRIICREAGAAIAYTEMLNISSILRGAKSAEDMMRTDGEDGPHGVQITGRTVGEFEQVVPHVDGFGVVDINCGCPSVRITNNGSGSFLLRNPGKVGSMVRVLKDAGLTVTAKVRLGFRKNNVIRVAKEVERAGADAITVHARMAHHGASVPADWAWIERVKESVGIPVIGNGDVFTGADAERMLEICDGAMVARAAIGDPMVFSRMLYFLRTGKEKEPDMRKNMELFVRYLDLEKEKDLVDVSRIKKVGSRFVRGFGGAAAARDRLMKSRGYDEVRSCALRILEEV